MEESRKALLQRTADELNIGGVDNSIRESETILETILDCSRNNLYSDSLKIVSNSNIQKIDKVVKKRVDGIPLQYALRSTYFYSSNFKVSPAVLIPRPDTETLIAQVLNDENSKSLFFADIGTGSGAIAATLINENSRWRSVAIDISIEALNVAVQNFNNGLIYPLCNNLLMAVKRKKQFDFIVSNPPYISAKEMERLDESVSGYEPHKALYGGVDGLDFYRSFSKELSDYVKDNGRLYCEIGYDQGEQVKEIFLQKLWRDVKIVKDLAGRDRVMVATVPELKGENSE